MREGQCLSCAETGIITLNNNDLLQHLLDHDFQMLIGNIN